MAELDELAGNVPGVDALPATTRVAAVDEKRDAEPVTGSAEPRLRRPAVGSGGSAPKTAAGRSSVASGTYANGVPGGAASNMTAQPPPPQALDANEALVVRRSRASSAGTTFVSRWT